MPLARLPCDVQPDCSRRKAQREHKHGPSGQIAHASQCTTAALRGGFFINARRGHDQGSRCPENQHKPMNIFTPIRSIISRVPPVENWHFLGSAGLTVVYERLTVDGDWLERVSTTKISTTVVTATEFVPDIGGTGWIRIISVSGGTLYALPAKKAKPGQVLSSTTGWTTVAGDRIGLAPNTGWFIASIGGSSGGSGGGDASAANQVLQLAEETAINDKIADPTTAWSKYHNPAANTVATITKTTPGSGFRLVVTKISWRAATGTTAPTAAVATVSLVDNAGSPVTYWAETAPFPASACVMNGASLSCWIPLAENVAATLAFSGAGGANTYESVFMDGFVEAV